MDYDYIGSPWKFCEWGGNGGLSLRTVRVMRNICMTHVWDSNSGNEDIFFSNIMHNEKIGKLAPREVCRRFACETIFELGTMGVHAVEKYLTDEQVKQINEQYGN
jgi:hypothetical protein